VSPPLAVVEGVGDERPPALYRALKQGEAAVHFAVMIVWDGSFEPAEHGMVRPLEPRLQVRNAKVARAAGSLQPL
jgi:hypothetical protein